MPLSEDVYEASAVRTQWQPVRAPAILPCILELAPLRAVDIGYAGAYYAAGRFDINFEWRGATIYGCNEEDGDYAYIGELGIETLVGRLITPFSDGPFHYWDRTTEIDVEIFNGAPSSRPVIDVLNGANWMAIGDEVIAFVDVEEITDGYRLTTLLRGLRQSYPMEHIANERVVILQPSSVKFYRLNLTDIKTTKYIKMASPGSDLDNVMPIEHEVLGTSLKPLSVCHIIGTRDASNNLTITWIRRTRQPTRLFSCQPTPLCEESESYEIDITVGYTVRRTLTATSPTVTYTAAQQTADGITPGDPIKVRIYQMSASIGRGFTNNPEVTV